jgi:hypothetical protein
MGRNIAAAVTVGLIAATFIVIWSGVVRVKPEATAAVAMVDAAAVAAPMTSPFDIMMSHGKTLPVEQWRDAF